MERYSINRLGRFNAVDPIVSTASLNRYAYSGNDPINNTDPTGMLCIGGFVTPFDTCANSGLSDSGLSNFPGPSVTCILDGVPTPCGEVFGAIDRGEAGQCPNNVCRPGALLGADGNWYFPVYSYHPATLSYLWLPNPNYDPLKFGDQNNAMFVPAVELKTGGWGWDTTVASANLLPLLQPVTPTVVPSGPKIEGLPEPPSLEKKTNSHSYLEFLACSVPQGIENLEKMRKPMTVAIAGALTGLRTGRPWMIVAGFAGFAGVTMGPALKTRAECNERVGGVIPNPF